MGMLNHRLLLLVVLLLLGCDVLAARLTLNERRIQLQGQDNFRDLGGYTSDDGRRLKTGVFYRSGALNALSDSDLTLLTKLGIKTVIELRSAREVAMVGRDRLPSAVKPVVIPISVAAFEQPVQDAIDSGSIAAIPPDLHQQQARSMHHRLDLRAHEVQPDRGRHRGGCGRTAVPTGCRSAAARRPAGTRTGPTRWRRHRPRPTGA